MIQARGLARSFRTDDGPLEAVRGIDLDVAEGELVALLGPNGAGKSTTLRMLTTLLPPTAGTAVVAGHDVARHPAAVRRRIGFIGQGNGAGHYHHVRDELVLQGRAYGLGWRDARRRAAELLDAFALGEVATRTTGTLSGGQRRRLDIAMSLVHAPPLLFLDEPSTGLDPQNRAHLWAHVLDVRERSGATLLLTTHYLEEADTMAERVMVIDHGRVIADAPPARLKADLAGDLVALAVTDPADVGAARQVVERVAPGAEVEVRGPDLSVRVPDGAGVLPGLLAEVQARGVGVRRAEVTRPTLDDVFLALTGRSLREEGATAEDVARRDGAAPREGAAA